MIGSGLCSWEMTELGFELKSASELNPLCHRALPVLRQGKQVRLSELA